VGVVECVLIENVNYDLRQMLSPLFMTFLLFVLKMNNSPVRLMTVILNTSRIRLIQ